MTEKTIQQQLRLLFCNYEYVLCNTFIFNWESDFFAISKPAGYSVEVEIKCSKADFKKDFTDKTAKHNLFINHKKAAILQSKHPFKPYIRNNGVYDPDTYQFNRGDSSYVNFKCPADHIPNKFYYACPEGLLYVEDIPAYAGLLYIGETRLTEVKKAPFLHKKKHDHTETLLQKYYWKHLNDRRYLLIMLNDLENHFESKDFTTYQKKIIESIKQKFL